MPARPQSVGAKERAALIPGEILPLFNDTFVRSCELLEEYVARLAAVVFRSTGLERSCANAVTVEEASIGGFGAHVLTMASDEGLVDGGLKIRTMRLPDAFLDHDKPDKQYDEAGLNAPQIVETVLKALRVNSAGVEEVRA